MRAASIVHSIICAFAVSGLVLAASCHTYEPTSGPETRCVDKCKARAPDCGDHACVRGCRFVLDRLVEKEADNVLACVGKAEAKDKMSCAQDRTWAVCAVNIGPYADGGPPAPTFKRWEDEDNN